MDVSVLVLAAGSAGLSAYVLAGGRGRALGRTGPAGAEDGPVAALVRAVEGLPALRRARERSELARRRSSCLMELPVLLDVVTLGLSAGLSFDSALELYCGRYASELGRAFSEALLSWRMGAMSREAALERLAASLDVAALTRFVSVVNEALAFGTPLSQTLEQQAQAIRDEQRSQVEEAIEKVPVKMLVPLGTLIVPAMFLAILGPLLGSALSF